MKIIKAKEQTLQNQTDQRELLDSGSLALSLSQPPAVNKLCPNTLIKLIDDMRVHIHTDTHTQCSCWIS